MIAATDQGRPPPTGEGSGHRSPSTGPRSAGSDRSSAPPGPDDGFGGVGLDNSADGIGDTGLPSALPPSVRAAIAALDRAVDDWFEPLRGRPSLDAAAKLAAGLSDHGLVWALEAAWRARRRGPGRRQAVRELAVAGIGSSLVNAAVKSAVGRTRPDRAALELRGGRVPVREPTSSSFPSGHTLAAFCVATVTADRRRPWATATRFALAGLVGASRVHLRAHHASDVLGGMVVGVAVGCAGRLAR